MLEVADCDFFVAKTNVDEAKVGMFVLAREFATDVCYDEAF